MDLGRQVNRVSREGNRLTSRVDIDIDVSIFGVRLYSYEMRNTEVWENGVLMSVDAETVENSEDRDFVRARRVDGALAVESSKFDGMIEQDVATTTYWTKAFLNRNLWLSTQDGERYQVAFAEPQRTEFRTGQGKVPATRYRVLGDLELSLYYDLDQEWIGTAFNVQGRSVRIFADDTTQPLAPLWFDT